MPIPSFLLILTAAFVGTTLGAGGSYLLVDLLAADGGPVSIAIVAGRLNRFIPAILLALVGVALTRNPWARAWIWLPTLAGFVLGMGYHLTFLNVAAGLFRIDERIPMLLIGIGWLHWETQRLFAGTNFKIVHRDHVCK